MRMLTCYLPPSQGEAKVAGFDIAEESMEVRKRIGYLPEQPPLYHDMTVNAYLRFVAKIKGVPSAALNSRIDDTMEKTGIAHQRHTVIGHLSKGYRQRVGLAQALAPRARGAHPRRADCGLGSPSRSSKSARSSRGWGATTRSFSALTSLPEVSMTCGQLAIINNGRIAGQGTPESLMAQLKEGEMLRAHIDGPQRAGAGHDRPARGRVGGGSRWRGGRVRGDERTRVPTCATT